MSKRARTLKRQVDGASSGSSSETSPPASVDKSESSSDKSGSPSAQVVKQLPAEISKFQSMSELQAFNASVEKQL